MYAQLIKDGTGKLLKSATDQLLKTRPYNVQLIADSLIGEFDADHIENIDGYARTMYNLVSGGANFLQTVSANQPILMPNFKNGYPALNFRGGNSMLINLTNVKQIFLVGKLISRDGGQISMGPMSWYNNFTGFDFNRNENPNVLKNNKVYNLDGATMATQVNIVTNYNNLWVNSISNIITYNNASDQYAIMAMSMYSRKLSIEEIRFIMQSYGEKYNIYMEA